MQKVVLCSKRSTAVCPFPHAWFSKCSWIISLPSIPGSFGCMAPSVGSIHPSISDHPVHQSRHDCLGELSLDMMPVELRSDLEVPGEVIA